jgi:hypothetical protein
MVLAYGNSLTKTAIRKIIERINGGVKDGTEFVFDG